MGLLWPLASRIYILSGPAMMLIYPLYASILSIESADKEDDQQWLTYWVLYSLVSLMEMAAGPVLAWIPFYSTFKLIIASWLVLPQFRGGIILYQKFVSLYLNSTTGVSDQKLTEGQRKLLGSISSEAQALVATYIKENRSDAFDRIMKIAVEDLNVNKLEEVMEKESPSDSDSDSD